MSRREQVFFARTLEEALAAARRELGPEALLVEAGPAAPGEASAGAYRVVCQGGQDAGGSTGPEVGRAPGGHVQAAWGEVCARLQRLERMLETVAGSAAGPESQGEAAVVRAELESQDLPGRWIGPILREAGQRVARAGGAKRAAAESAVREAVAEELLSRIGFRPQLGEGRRPAVVVLAGPPGSGKTATLVKLAMREGLARRRSAAIVTTDGHRVAAAEQLRTYAAILGLPFCQAETPAALRQAVAEHAARELILVDTPGFGPNESDWAQEWAGLLGAVPERQTLLVLPAAWRTRDLLAALPRWSVFEPAALVFTRLDETEAAGGWMAAALESGLPVAYFGTGQGIPEDIEPASGERVRRALAARAPHPPAFSQAAGGAP